MPAGDGCLQGSWVGAHCPHLWPPVSAASPVLLRAQQPCPPEALGQGELQRGLQTPAEVFAWEAGVWWRGWGCVIVRCCLEPEGNRSGCKDGPREHRAQMDSGQGSDAEAKLLFPLQPTLGPRLPSHL